MWLGQKALPAAVAGFSAFLLYLQGSVLQLYFDELMDVCQPA